MITFIEHKRETSLLLANQIPATFDGRLRVNIANAMAAAAAAFAQDLQLEYVRLALRTFTSTFFQTPGRFNQLEVAGRRVILDYCHNIAGLESMADFVKRVEAERTVGLIAMPGDRSNGDIEAFGKLAGKTFDELVIREDTNTRGRGRGAQLVPPGGYASNTPPRGPAAGAGPPFASARRPRPAASATTGSRSSTTSSRQSTSRLKRAARTTSSS
jgi:cyanophycin synthetase